MNVSAPSCTGTSVPGVCQSQFDAKRYEDTYGRSTTVQSSALQTLIIIKVWSAFGCTIFDEYKELESEARNLRFDNAQALLLPSPPAPFFAWVCPKAPWIRKSFSVVVDCMFWSMPPVMFGQCYPNTTGSISGTGGPTNFEINNGEVLASGDFYLIKHYGEAVRMAFTDNQQHFYRNKYRFDASRTCGIYSSSATVQPPALQTLIIIRVWKAGGCTELASPYKLELFAQKSHNHKRLSPYRYWRECLLYNDKKRQATYLSPLPRANRILGIDLKTRLCSGSATSRTSQDIFMTVTAAISQITTWAAPERLPQYVISKLFSAEMAHNIEAISLLMRQNLPRYLMGKQYSLVLLKF